MCADKYDVDSLLARCEQGDLVAAYVLADLHYYGHYTPQDMFKAKALYVDVADRGHWGAKGRCHEWGWGSYERDGKKKVECWQKGREEGDPVSIDRLGFCYQHGIDVEEDKQKAAALYEEAACLGYANAISYLGYCYDSGEGVGVDKKKAASLYIEAADKGWPDAIYNLAACYDEGDGVEKDCASAIELFKRAADIGYEDGRCALRRRGVEYIPKMIGAVEVKLPAVGSGV